MELKIRPYHKNSYSRSAVLIKGADAGVWLKEIYRMGLEPENISMYALPGSAANELFGCLVVPRGGTKVNDIGKHNFMQCVNNVLFIPENTIISPGLSSAEWNSEFTAAAYVIHQETGLIELTEEIDWDALIAMPELKEAEITVPSKGVYIPRFIRSLSIEADEAKLAEVIEGQVEKPDSGKLPFNIDKVMKGNQKEIDKLLKYLEKHPEEALKLGIPLDSIGSSRGGGGGRFKFGKTGSGMLSPGSDLRTLLYVVGVILGAVFLLGLVFSGKVSSSFPFILFVFIGRFLYSAFKNDKRTGRTGGGLSATIDHDKFSILRNRYEQLAEDFIAQKEYQKAAGVYLKLLKDNYGAAQVLEDGGYYGEAGAIYLKYCKDKPRAAECFEKGRLYAKAIDIYKELEKTEKVAELYAALNNEAEASRYYAMVAEDYVKNNQFVKASLIYRKKMGQPLKAQELLLEGWHKKFDAHNCLNNYFANIDNVDVLAGEIKRFYANELEDSRMEAFLQVIKIEFHKHESLQVPVREIAYEIIAGSIEANPFIASELMGFNPKDTSLSKDVMKFKAQKNRRE
ncbi:hypothetical protein HYN59_16520 [Flavobacterium album]|uniref:Cyclic nucleotide-binding domain-containing protein n=1 Tax=Flavobacterium album TaxID=2175091 RepID=A0A2S1R1U9_9FLAO|nr:hypothetical protein [Flavobacterium album]AWH86614.1 hypothetical protein HYN59_16520 [Flavobacterium album]